jgi:hypothetical protein
MFEEAGGGAGKFSLGGGAVFPLPPLLEQAFSLTPDYY